MEVKQIMVNKANKFHIYNKVQATLTNKTIGYFHFVLNPFLSLWIFYTIEVRKDLIYSTCSAKLYTMK
ncbi:hypothetical protein BK749_15890 [Bacillus thuringiensis serovar vazensis]|uniref:Transposase n=1 Tax=Bacillus thuringiensis serovar vazensis TaxID=180867 RepID=A0A243CXJ2_BACTU|nr:hypothetical protein BK749_15890 [Bacillus thuringiensis serovar vazensis]